MRYAEILHENTPQTLYHGTLRQFVPAIMELGLLPTVGDFTRYAYGDYVRAGIKLPALVFASDRTGLTSCVSAILGALQKSGVDDTSENFFRYGAIVVLKHASKSFNHRPPDTSSSLNPIPPSEDHPATVEPNDYYSDEAVIPSFAIMGDRLRTFLRRHGEMFDSMRFDRKAVQTELITLISKRHPELDIERIAARVRGLSDTQVEDYLRRFTWGREASRSQRIWLSQR